MITKIYDKPRIKPKLFILLMLFFVSLNAYPQQPKLCSGYKINTVELSKALQFEKSNKALAAQHYLIRVYFHIARNDDGSSPAATLSQIQNEFQTLQSDYASDNICFLNAGLDYINNTSLNDANIGGGSSAFTPYTVANCINIFYCSELYTLINGTKYLSGGTAFTIPSTLCAIASSNINEGHSVSHETGHCFGLLHTFEPKYSSEDINGNNCSAAADLICDTKADPYYFYVTGQSCFSTSQFCTTLYNGTCSDPNGQTNYSPPYSNMMAYWWAYYNCFPDLTISSDQFTRINSFLNTNTNLQACESPDNVTFGPVSQSSGYIITSALNSFTTSGTVNLTGTLIATLVGQNVTLNNGFSAIPSAGGLVTIETAICNYTVQMLANNPSQSFANYNSKLLSNLNVYPNPTSSFVRLRFATDKEEEKIKVQMFDMQMKLVKEISLNNILKGNQNVSVNLSGLASGIYFIQIQTKSKIYIQKVVKD